MKDKINEIVEKTQMKEKINTLVEKAQVKERLNSALEKGQEAKKEYESKMKDPNSGPLYRAAAYLVGTLVTILVVSTVYRVLHHAVEVHQLASEVEAGPNVRVAVVGMSSDQRTETLLGESKPFQEVTLYTKVSGFLTQINVDKGDKVEKDQILAIVSSPETSQQYAGALADARNKRTIANRMRPLLAQNLVSVQDAQQSYSDADVAEAKLQQQGVMKGYQVLKAPFSGQITARYTDAGTLVQNAANSAQSAQPLVTISDIDHLRIYVYLDQKDAYFVKPGFPVEISVAERPEVKIKATITRMTGELDSKTRTLLTEIDLDNTNHELVPGSFVYVSMKIKTTPHLAVPAEALVLHNGKHSVVVVSPDNTIHYREIEIADDDGKMIRVLSGIKEGEIVALNLGNTIEDGSRVRPKKG